MIIYGDRCITSSFENGNFYCPTCTVERDYQWYKVRKWFTLYFIPLIPLNIVGEYIECGACENTYETEAVEYDADRYEADQIEFEAEYQKAVRNIMILMMLVDGKIDPEEIDVIQEIYSQLTGNECDQRTLEHDIAAMKDQQPKIKDFINGAIGLLNENGKIFVYKAAFLVAIADGEIAKKEEKLIKSLGKGLGLSRSIVKEIRADLLS